jgi:hypothetical protein
MKPLPPIMPLRCGVSALEFMIGIGGLERLV